MGRTWIDSAVEGAQGLIPRDLEAAERRAVELTQNADNPSGRIRALALRVQILGHRGKLEAALCLYTEAREEGKRRQASQAALAELNLKGAHVYIRAGLNDDARSAIREARTQLSSEIHRAKNNTSDGGKLRYKWLKELEAIGWIMSGLAAMVEANPAQAYRDALTAASISQKEAVQISALDLLSVAATSMNQPGALAGVLHLNHEAEKRLRNRDLPLYYLTKTRWNRALTLERAGLPEEADEIMTGVAEWYASSEYQEDAKRAHADWERIRTAARAAYQRRRPA